MSLITDILGGNLLSGIKGIIGEFVVDPTQRAQLAAQAQQLAVQQAALIDPPRNGKVFKPTMKTRVILLIAIGLVGLFLVLQKK